MPGDRVTLATVPDEATARLLCEVLTDGGIEGARFHVVPGNAYLGRAQAVDYEVRVEDIDEERALLVLRDFESESAQAVTAQAASSLPDGADDSAPLPNRKRLMKWGFYLIAFAMFGPLLIGIIRVLIQKYL